jgi:hypothetical protein
MTLRSGRLRALTCGLAVWIAVIAGTSSDAQQVSAQSREAAQKDKFNTTLNYVVQFYPLWFSYYQSLYANHNRLAGPDRISPVYQIVVAINNDTLYASTFLDVSAEPVILTIPSTVVHYSVLVLDPYGDIFETAISTQTAAVYALTGPGFVGSVPGGTTQIALPFDHMVIIFRADKFSSTGEKQKRQAEVFRRSLLMQTQSEWQKDPSGGATVILPELFFGAPFKLAADRMIARDPIRFLELLQAAVASTFAPPLTPHQQKLSDHFNQLFAASGQQGTEFSDGAQAAHDSILQNYLTHTGPTNWINFTNIGNWTRHEALDRSSIAEFIQYGNDHDTAAYYHAFADGRGRPLDGTDPAGYVLKIPKDKIPQAERFWSFTAYTPETVELVRNSAHKYEIASYTPGLRFNGDGSLTLYLAVALPAGVTEANWLPIPSGPFNIMLRVYGPEGDVAAGTYIPPAIRKR